ncbi:M15 family metallopeptidase [Paenibacillus sp. sgz302251]|uniref:M15 family metallopeptidase n=1 Tax=Paenibacillus sp. sgz302251 TaxID=3414493 RepID=UPI003C7EB275
MKKRKRRLLLFAIVCAAMIVGYNLMKENESVTIPLKETAAEAGTQESGGEVQGELGAGAMDQAAEEEAAATEEPAASGDERNGQAAATTDASVSSTSGQAEVTEDGLAVIAEPANIAVLVNKQHKLPEDYNPSDLEYPDVRFLFSEKIEKRKLRKEAAEALEKMFAAAEDNGIHLAGVSAYRSHSTQKTLFARYVDRDGLEKARTYSAFPGTSEHETGLAIDVSGSDGKCAAADCFANTEESQWLEAHAHEYGYIIRYLKGKETITGYQYEPWHLRYVGMELAEELEASGETLEEYYDAVPVNS